MTDFYSQLEDQLVAAGRRRLQRGPVRRAVAGRGRALVAVTAAVAVLVAGCALALSALRTTAPTGEPARPVAPTTSVPAAPPGPARDRTLAGIRIAVFNATATRGLGDRVGGELRSHGAHVAVFGSGPPQPGGRTIVRYAPHAAADARRVANVLGVARVDRYDPSGPDGNPPASARAQVIVLVGYDHRPRP
ncbi:MAG: LytR cell envelope-related transcriptional attenuator [Solirubrobacteraceae bacterium]|jgi:hypothetical protein|nr:LytR cell envelope-related transcriptional attenuator [Solirubrobacteraceae bacterium]